MALSNEQIREYNKRLLLSRMRILINNSFYGLLLMHMKLALDEECETAATDGDRIWFGPKFLDKISDEELDFIMMHEILHVALRHCYRDGNRDPELFNVACDIVVNSNILKSNDMNLKSITVKEFGESMHLTPDKKEGYDFSAEEVYQFLVVALKNLKPGESLSLTYEDFDGNSKNSKNDNGNKSVDDHSKWQESNADADDPNSDDKWKQRIIEAAKAVERQQENDNSRGAMPAFAERMLKELRESQIDWKTILSEFVQEEICDYTFSPPDRRFSDSPFFLPDFNGVEYFVSDILFMIDTSGSMSPEMITAAFSEVKGAIEQFDGKLQGLLGFFDGVVIPPVSFDNVNDLINIKAIGGGGTRFDIIFDYVNKHMQDNPPKSIIILTDGYAPFPEQKITNNIPVLWLLNNTHVTPPWGKIARIKL